MIKILLVEDNEMIQGLTAHYLRKRGYSVITATDGQEGIDKAQSERPDIILMDMQLPLVNGWDAVQAIRVIPKTKDIPIIAVTAKTRPGDRERCLQAGCNEYEAKPVGYHSLLKKIKQLTLRIDTSVSS